MIARLCGVAIDARVATRTRDPYELARATRWIAANYLALRRQRPMFFVRIERLGELISTLAVAPVLVDGGSLPARWRLALRACGIPLIAEPPPERASVLSLVPLAGGGHRVRLAEPRMLAA